VSAFDWKSQVIVVTGASAGIGAALVHAVARRGARVVLAARRQKELDEVARAAGGEHLVVVADVTRRADIERIAASAIDRFGHVDVWVSNAGRGITRPLLAATDDDVDQMIAVNLKSALYAMQAIVPHFQSRGRGHLVDVSTMLARIPFVPTRSVYMAAKAALGSLSETLRMELAQKHPEIRVTAVYPGVVATDFGLNALGGGPDSRSLPGAQPVEDVAAVIADAIEAQRGGDVYTQPGSLERVLGYVRGLGQGT
jgi:NAD(P)-dependent dehydrogenase (short-subunit alcohol dehydrogenase family)